ncbi:MAG TPA: hypothetical protein VD769_11265 [Gaiellaceae bacterium]|nr:hypothetical protein [Gaiellaceae bacterium]
MSDERRTPIRLEVRVDARPEPGLLRAAIERRLAGRAFVAGPEGEVAAAVARALERDRAGGRSWR